MSKPEIADPVYANMANLAATVLASGISSGDTTISVVSASMLPAVSFYATIAPAGGMSDTQNSEIVLVTAISGNTLTVERAQRGTTAKSFEAGAVIFNGVYVHDVAYDASGLFDTKFNVYPDPSGLAQAIVDGRPLVIRDGGNTGGIWNMVNVVSATIDNYSGSDQMPTANIVYVSDGRLVTAVVDLSTGAITRSGATIATNGNRVLSGDNILANSITSDNIDFATFNNAPIEAKTVSGPYGISINLLRTLNVVFYSIFDSPNGIPQSGTSNEAIPVGFRPHEEIVGVVRQDNGEAGRWTIMTDGKCSWFLPAAGNPNVTLSIAYPTDDQWPTS